MPPQQAVHPMVAVPDAIRCVLRQTARVMMEELSPGDIISGTETVSSDAPWNQLLDRTLSEDVVMQSPGYPPYRASIMDGYAISTKDSFSPSDDAIGRPTHHVVGNVYAGDTASSEPSSSRNNQLQVAYYITTGAVVPDDCDCVVPIEECSLNQSGSKIAIKPTASIEPQKWIRPVGCDISEGSVVLPKDHVLDPVALGLIKQSGARTVSLKRPIRVGVMSTGNELILGSEDHKNPGKIPDVNRPILLSLISSFHCTAIDLGIVRDDSVDAMATVLLEAMKKCDVILTTGGISMGETDIVERVLIEHCKGTLHFGRMHMKPGKPTTFVTVPDGSQGTKFVFAMPGNPVSGTVCTQLLVKPCLDLLMKGFQVSPSGDKEVALDAIVEEALVHPEIEASLTADIKLDAVRPEYHRVILNERGNGDYEATTTGVQRSSRLMSLRDAEALLVLPEVINGKIKAMRGEKYTALLLGGRIHSLHHRVPVKRSKHLNNTPKKKKQSKILVVEVSGEGCDFHVSSIAQRVETSLSGTKSGTAKVISKETFKGDACEIYDFVAERSHDVDVAVVACSYFDGSFPYFLDVSSALKKRLSKVADALASQARQGAAGQDPVTAIFEPTVGYIPEGNGAILVCIPTSGLDQALGNIRGLLKHALNVSRGKPHNHHHK